MRGEGIVYRAVMLGTRGSSPHARGGHRLVGGEDFL